MLKQKITVFNKIVKICVISFNYLKLNAHLAVLHELKLSLFPNSRNDVQSLYSFSNSAFHRNFTSWNTCVFVKTELFQIPMLAVTKH